jgi:protein-S-isoprenylcysteine O-methyltransferase Ste14
MTTEPVFRLAFLILLAALIAMRVYFMIKVRRSGGRIMPDAQAVRREGSGGFFIFRVVAFCALMAFLVMYFLGAAWIEAFSFPLPAWLRWTGFALGVVSVIFWAWTQVMLDTQWSAQLQLTKEHHLVTTGPYARMRHPLYTAMIGWCAALSLLTANWIFVGVSILTIAGLIVRVPKEEQMMIEAFGDEYQAYIQRTGQFFPRLGK